MNQMTKPFAITLDPGTSLANRTGSWRTRRPVYVDRLPPCNHACPAGENIQQWLFHAEEGNYHQAWLEIMKNNPFPAAMGRVCYHPCEGGCNRGKLDESVGINAVERFLGDKAVREGWKIEVEAQPSGKKVMVVGAGPAGLSAAYHLARLGHAVTVFESAPQAGGMMRWGIPKYRLPRGTLDAEIARIQHMGVDIRLNTRIDDLPAAMKQGGFGACFLSVGAHLPRMIKLPGAGAEKILDAVAYLRSVEHGRPLNLGERVVVYGGGNTAIDVARSARRFGAQVMVVTRGPREKMSAHEFEIKEAIEEGVLIRNLHTLTQVDNAACILETQRVDDHGKLHPTGNFETVAMDAVVLALGQECDLTFLAKLEGLHIQHGAVQVDARMMTGMKGVFAGGDMIPENRTVTTAIGHGKKAARNIDAYLKGADYEAPSTHEVVDFEKLNPWYYTDAPKTIRPTLDLVRRQSGFEEVVGNLDETNALFEARRCLSCGNCFSCDNCYGVCPDNAVIKLEEDQKAPWDASKQKPWEFALGEARRYEFNYDYCKGCGLCVAECPCGAIRMEAETL
jgi:NADPH-dependent glutamate synthase beta subunit-like oxidoreductase